LESFSGATILLFFTDVMSGVRGELGLSIKLTYIGDVNVFRDSSAGVRLLPFSTLDPVAGYKISHVFGFVEELVVASVSSPRDLGTSEREVVAKDLPLFLPFFGPCPGPGICVGR
jgi:hypothetical protein